MSETIEIELTDEQYRQLSREADERLARHADTKDEIAELGEATADELAHYLVLKEIGEVY